MLGGTVDYRFPDDGEPVYVSLAMGSSILGIGVAGTPPNPAGMMLWFYVDDVDRVTRAVAAEGFVVVEQPADMPWGERVSMVLDPFGGRVRFGSSASS